MSQLPLRTIPDAILWHEGMMLRPDHFEQMTSRQELLLQYHASSPQFAWGVSRVAIDEAALMRGRFSLLELEAKLPDGLALRVCREDETQPSINLAELELSFHQQPFYIYLAARSIQSPEDAAETLRYVAVSQADETLRDAGETLAEEEDEEEGQLPIPRLRPRFHLVASPRGVSSKYTSMPIAKLGLRNGAWIREESYVPPSERCSSDSPLARGFVATLRRIRELAMFTQDRWRSMSAEERRQNPQEAVKVRHLVAALPVSEALLASGPVHPFSLYLGLCSLAGQVAALASEPVPPPFRPYDHNDPAPSFAEVDGYLNQVLSEGDSRDYLGFPMTYDQGVFSVQFAPEWSGRRLIVALRALATQESGGVTWFESALIGSRGVQESMRERRMLGAGRDRLASESGLFAGSGVVLYFLHEDRSFIRAGEMLDIASGPTVPGSSVPIEIILYVRQT